MNSPSNGNRYKKVLLIDDDKVDTFISDKIIRAVSLAADVITKNSAEEGLNYLKSLADTPDELPEIIFLDLEMPGMNGFDFLNEFAKVNDSIKARCKIIILTGSFNSNSSALNDVRKNSVAKKILTKPLTIDMLNEI